MSREPGTEPPSKRKQQKAREQGEIAVSRELASASAVCAAVLALAFSAKPAAAGLLALARRCFQGGGTQEWFSALQFLLLFVATVGGAAAAAALVASAAQVGFRLRLKLDPSRLDPVKGFGRLFSRERLVDLVILIARAAALAWIGWWCLLPLAGRLLPVGEADLTDLARAGGLALLRLAGSLAGTTLVLGALDFLVQRRRFLRRARMTREEVLRERKEQEGDPQIRSERRRRHRQLIQGTGLAAVRRATLVVVNPTHLAVALRYQPGEDDAPTVLASGRDLAARRIREEAARAGVPVVQHVSLARALMAVEPGEEIPEALYLAAAEVIRAVQAVAS